MNPMASSLVSTRTQEWKERCFSGHPPSPGGQSHSSQDRVAYAWDSRGPCSLPSLRCYRQTPLLLSEGRLGKTVSQVAGRRQCQFPSWESGLGRNVLAGSAGSLCRTPARSGGLGPFSVQSSSLRLSLLVQITQSLGLSLLGVQKKHENWG